MLNHVPVSLSLQFLQAFSAQSTSQSVKSIGKDTAAVIHCVETAIAVWQLVGLVVQQTAGREA